MKMKALFLLVSIFFQGALLGAEKSRWRPKPGYWYNETNSVIEVTIRDFKPGVTAEPIYLEPYELIKMQPFQPSVYIWFANGASAGYMVSIMYKKRGAEKEGCTFLTSELLSDFGSEYVFVFRDDPKAKTGLKYKVVHEKPFREKLKEELGKELEACPVPGGVQRIISGYVLP